MRELYAYSRVRIEPRAWPRVVGSLGEVRPAVEDAGGVLCGLFLPQIGLPADEGLLLAGFPDRAAYERGRDVAAARLAGVLEHSGEGLAATVRPEQPGPVPAGGVYAHRRFRLRAADWEEFQSLSEQAWPGFEKRYEARVFGLFRGLDEPAGEARALLLTRYADLGVWEASRMEGRRDAEQEQVRSRFRSRHELTEHTVVVTTRPAPL